MSDLERRIERIEKALRITPLDMDDEIIRRLDDVRRLHGELRHVWRGPEGRHRQEQTLLALHDGGWTLDEIARATGYTRERIRVLRRAAVDAREAGCGHHQ